MSDEISLDERERELRIAENNLGVVASVWLDLKAMGVHPDEMGDINADVTRHELNVKRAARKLQDTRRRLERKAA